MEVDAIIPWKFMFTCFCFLICMFKYNVLIVLILHCESWIRDMVGENNAQHNKHCWNAESLKCV